MWRWQRRGVWLIMIAGAVISLIAGNSAVAAAAPGDEKGPPRLHRTAPLLPDPGKPTPPPADEGIHVAPNPAAANVPAKQLKAMQRDLKITEMQAKDRLVRADWAGRLDPRLRERLGKAFAGSWLAKDGHEFVVAVTDSRLEPVVRASGASPRLMERSEAELLAIGEKLSAHVKKAKRTPDKMAGWVIDPQTGQVRVQVLPGGLSAAKSFVAAAGLRADEVGYENVPGPARKNTDVLGGDKYVVGTGGYCSVGFAVTYPRTPGLGKPGYLTAGHCYESPNTYVEDADLFGHQILKEQGLFVAAVTSREDDEAIVQTNAGFTPRPLVNGYGRAPILVSDGDPQVDGSPVCESGATTLYKCGTIRAGWQFPTLDGVQFQNLKATDTCTKPGDSGGSVISGTHAQGIHIGSNRCPWFFRYSYYVPVQRALNNLGAALRTTPVPTTPPPPGGPSPKWAGQRLWDGLGGSVKGQVASASLSPGLVQVFGRGTDDRLYTNTSTDGTWSGWQGLGDVLTEPPTALARSGGIDVYYRGADTRPYLRRWNGAAWEPAVKLGDIDVEGTIAAVSQGPGQVILFIRSSDDEVKYNFYDGSAWSGWLGLGGDVNAAPTAIARPNAAGQIVLEVYARWADDNVRYRRLDPAGPAGWQPWVNLGGIWKDTPVGVTVGPNESWLIGWARDNTAHVQRWKDGDWLHGSDGSINTGWRGLGGDVQSPPTAVVGGGGQIRVFARDTNQRINMITWPAWNDINWESWVPLDGDTVVPVDASRRAPAGDGQVGTVDVVGVDAATGQPFHITINVSSPAPQLSITDADVRVGIPTYLIVTGPPGAPVYWSSTHDGVPVENRAFYNEYLDGDGKLVRPIGSTGYSPGAWTMQAQVGTLTQRTAQVSYTVSYQPVAVFTDKPAYQVGEDVSFVVTGPPLAPIRWSSTINGQSSGENNASYNQTTDINGAFLLTGKWTDPRTGGWVKQVNVNGQTAQVAFDISGPPPPPPPSLRDRPMSAAATGDDRMHAVAWGDDQRFYARDQLTGGGSWSPWYPLADGVLSGPPTAVVNHIGQVEVYGVGTDARVYRNVHTGTGAAGWSGWVPLTACCVKDKLSVTRDRFGRMNVFGVGTDNNLYLNREADAGSNTWTGWVGMGGPVSGAPSGVSFEWNFHYYTFVFAAAPDGDVYHNVAEDVDAGNRTYGSWLPIGGPVAGVTAVATPTGNNSTLMPFALFVRGTDQRIYYFDNRVPAFQPLTDAAFAGDPVAVAGASPNVFSVMARGSDQQVYFNRQTCRAIILPCLSAAWSGWSAIGTGALRADPAAARLSTERLLAFGLDPNRQPLVNNQAQPDSSSWSGWINPW